MTATAAIDLPYPGIPDELAQCPIACLGVLLSIGALYLAAVTVSWLPLLLPAAVIVPLYALKQRANRVYGLPPDQTMRELTQTALGRNPHMFGQAAVGVYPQAIWERMVGVIAEELVYPAERIVPDTRFVEDLQL